MTARHGITLHRGSRKGTFRIGTSSLRIRRHITSGRYMLVTGTDAGHAWLEKTGLADLRMTRLGDLVDVVAAHAAVHPLPISRVSQTQVRLHRQPDGSHITDTGDFTVRPITSATARGYERGHRWLVTPAAGTFPSPGGRPARPLTVRTLRHARERIASQRLAARSLTRAAQRRARDR